ncbi:MAG: hypothetical protein FGM43_01640 [Sinobacteraceae bacterium]|nr:hypothetical protein [Nevskiaceae bacterium]
MMRLFSLTILSLALLGLAGCETTAGGGSPPSGGASGGGASGGVSTGGGFPGGGLPGAGLPGMPGLPNPTADSGRSTTAGSSSGETGNDAGGEATTAEERRAVLSGRLDKSLGDFDKTLEEEQRRSAEERDARATSGRGALPEDRDGAGGGGSRGTREGDLRSERTAQQGASGSKESPGGDTQDRGSVAGGSGSPDRGIPSGEDDDIVARRLRRAAEQETDPELKEKLWKEYADYKRNVQGKG